jgi:6-phosphogluconolactonase
MLEARVLDVRGVQVLVFPDPNSVALALAESIRRAAQQPIKLALAGGSTPTAAYRLLAESEDRSWVPNVEWFFGDDRYVPPTHEQSNERMARECLAPLELSEYAFHGMVTSDDPDEAARRYEQLLRLRLGDIGFDLLLAGIGDDGHTLSLFPGEMGVLEESKWVIAANAPVNAPIRITITPPLVALSAQTILTATGSGKAIPLERMLLGEKDWLRTPSQCLLAGRLTVLCDEAAANLLS